MGGPMTRGSVNLMWVLLITIWVIGALLLFPDLRWWQ